MKGIIIEGVAGSGKSTLVKRLQVDESLRARFENITLVLEEETIGELFAELLAGSPSGNDRLWRLTNLMRRIESDRADLLILERFHHSYYALGIDWTDLEPFDSSLSRLGFKTILLDLNDSDFESRCFHRPELKSKGWEEDFLRIYGSAKKSVDSFRTSQQRRRAMLALSQLSTEVINTSGMNWRRYTDKAVSYILSQ